MRISSVTGAISAFALSAGLAFAATFSVTTVSPQVAMLSGPGFTITPGSAGTGSGGRTAADQRCCGAWRDAQAQGLRSVAVERTGTRGDPRAPYSCLRKGDINRFDAHGWQIKLRHLPDYLRQASTRSCRR